MIISQIELIICQRTILDDNFSLFLRRGRNALTSFIKPRNEERNLKINFKSKTLQKQFKDDERFFCDLQFGARSNSSVPKSVHSLKPGDIDIIGAIGDSLTAANGGFATNTLQVALEARGISWSIGGEGDWKKYLTLPNILKLYNPKLYGYSVNEYSNSYEKSSKFNVAEAGAISSDTIHQAKNLVKRMRSDENVDIKNHWKLITYMVGGNDFCAHVCYSDNQKKTLEDAANSLILVLRILKQHLPRTLVNVVLPPDVSILLKMKTSQTCKALHYLECPCLFSPSLKPTLGRTLKTIKLWKVKIEEVAKMPEFHDTNVSFLFFYFMTILTV